MVKKKKNEEISIWKNWKFWILIALVVLFFNFSNNEDYGYCVDDCVFENEMCLMDYSDFASSGIEYILYGYAEECQYDLEDCVEECGR